MKLFTRFLDGLEKVLFAVASAAVVAMAAVLVLQVFLRYVLSSPTSWSEEFATLCFVWCVMLAIPLAIRHQEHISMTFVVGKLRGRAWSAAQIAINTVVGVTLVAIGVASLGLMHSGEHQLLAGLSSGWGIDIPLLVMYVAVPTGCLFSGFYAIEQILLLATGKIHADADEDADVDNIDARVEGTVA